MKPHIFKSVIYDGTWACCSKKSTPWGHRVCVPDGAVYYGRTPAEAYNNWKEHHVGSARS